MMHRITHQTTLDHWVYTRQRRPRRLSTGTCRNNSEGVISLTSPTALRMRRECLQADRVQRKLMLLGRDTPRMPWVGRLTREILLLLQSCWHTVNQRLGLRD